MVSEKLINRLLGFAEGFAELNDNLATQKMSKDDEKNTQNGWIDPDHIRETVELVKYQLKEQEKDKPKSKLPSKFKNGDTVCLNFYNDIKIPFAVIIKVSFTESKVLYDIQVPVGQKGEGWTRFHSIDSTFVFPFEGLEKEK